MCFAGYGQDQVSLLVEQNPSTNVQGAAAKLESHPETIRIKKLCFYLSQQYWENDATKLNLLSFEELIQQVLQFYPDHCGLKTKVFELVGSLNRSDAYLGAAETLVNSLIDFYPDDSSIKRNRGQTFNIILDRVVACIKGQKDRKRTKKVIYAVCKDHWENDLNNIKAFSTKNLILELYETKPQLEDLQSSLSVLIENLNKSEAYTPIANNIIECFSLLYEYKKYKDDEENKNKTSKRNKTFENRKKYQSVEDFPITVQQDTNGKTLSQTKSMLKNREKTRVDDSAPSYPQEQNDIFELRFNVLQYTNPLRAKMLLLSILDTKYQEKLDDLSIVKNHTLESLLKLLLSSTHTLESLSYEFHQVINLFPNFEETQQTVDNLLKTIQPFLRKQY